MINLDVINKKMCTKCNGSCCKSMAGTYAPEDLGEITFENLKSLFDTGNFSIDWWEDDPPIYYIRPRHVDKPIIDPSWNGTCINLGDKGCTLPREKMPLQCKALVPNLVNGMPNCTEGLNKKQMADMWLPYQQILKQIRNEY